ncbi:hypothetical protein H0E87_027543 [Populus deltoides]|uniref:Pentatricopeptide repeat-containing protein n=1 Tax=Populus deltoides TaxID=3696 RepID=A0A8T2X265_POPDE|nr:hypothetical protein H0E87_027543 [Populus deltoides]
MWSNGKLEKNVNAYNVVFRVVGRREDWDSSERMIREMSESFGSELDCRVFNTLIYSCSKRGNVEWSRKWFRMMLELGVQPNIATFGMVMGLYQKDWNVEEAEFAFSEMRSFGITCQSAYSAMISIYTRLSLLDKAEAQGKLEKAELVLVSMQEAKFSPNTVACNILITGYGKVSNMFGAQWLFLGIQNTGLEPDETTYRSMIEGWGRVGNYKHGDEDGACRTLDDMLEMVSANVIAFSIVLRMYVKAGSLKDARSVLETMESEKDIILKSGVVWDQELYNCLINCCARALPVNELSRLFNEMLQRGFNLNTITFNDMLDVYAKAELFNKARELFMMARKRELRECGLRPDMCSYNTLIKAYGIAGTVEDAVCLVKEMRQNGIEPDEITYTNLITALQQNDKYLEAVKWSLWMKQRGL